MVSKHTDCIITKDNDMKNRFLKEVDSSSVMINTSTRFADGFEYGLGAEIGISTDKIHARGPVGLDGLTNLKYVVKAKELSKIKTNGIGLYFGSFDPVHNAHIDIPLSVLEKYPLEKIIYIPSSKSPIGKKLFANKHYRYQMLLNATTFDDRLVVDDYEMNLNNAIFTYDSICYFKNKYSRMNLNLIIGEDNFKSFESWYRYKIF